MLRKICSFLAVNLLLTNVCLSGTTLSTYNEITSKLAEGKTVIMNIDPSKCKIRSGDATDLKRLAIKFNDLYEFETSDLHNKKMRATAVQETGLFGDQRFIWYRNLTILLEDNSVAFITDVVDPTSYNLVKRVDILCKLTSDNSGGVIATLI